MNARPSPVRPTRSCLAMLGIEVPVLEVDLSGLDHELIAEAQRIPEKHSASGVQRISALSDRIWFKVKVRRWRGAATLLPEQDQVQPADQPVHLARWWLGAGGYRRDGDPTDFYASLAAIAARDGKSSGGPRSDRWLPVDWDWKRLELERARAWIGQTRLLVGKLITSSLRTGKIYEADFSNYRVKAMVRAHDGDTYLAVGSDHIADPRVLAVILSAVPGISNDSWQPEPGKVLGIPPQAGEVIWSTVLPPAVAAQLLESFPEAGR